MKRLSTIVFVLMLAALPLRGMAVVIAELCVPPQAIDMHAAHECCDDEDPQHGASHHGDQGQSEDGSCSHCAACSVGAPVVSDASMAVVGLARPGASAIPFSDRQVPAGIAERRDRPPLAL